MTTYAGGRALHAADGRGGSATALLQGSTRPTGTGATEGSRRFRADIQGLRAVAILLVVAYHAGVPGITGGYVGVDVFFVISGFLITGHLRREIERTGRLDLPAFYARRVRRLLPAAAVVILATLLVSRFWAPALEVRPIAWDAIWTAGYALNLHLGAVGVDYLAPNALASPLQHFWSLAVEEQFYVVWPVLLLAGAFAARRTGRRATTWLVGMVALGGLALCVVSTQTSAPSAYFSPFTRMWELCAGALVALAATRLSRLPGPVGAGASWAGAALVVASALRLDDSTLFPGVAALLPVAGAALVIAGGCSDTGRLGVGVVLDRGPMQTIGRLSYGWYLWHWPVLLLLPGALDLEPSWPLGLALSVVALGLARLTYVAVERPALRTPLRAGWWLRRGALLSGAAVAAATAVMLTMPPVVGSGAPVPALTLTSADGAALTEALTAAGRQTDVPRNLTPSLESAHSDVAVTESGCHLGFLEIDQGACEYGDLRASRTVVLFGDSHAQQWMGALVAEAMLRHWRIVSLTKAACPVADLTVVSPRLKRDYAECTTWRDRTVARITAMRPDLVLVSQSDSVPGTQVANDVWASRTVSTLERLRRGGTRVELLLDTPYPRTDVPICVADHLDDARACQVDRADAYHGSALFTDRHEQVRADVVAAGFPVLEPASWLCSATVCPVIVGDELVYRDDGHLTNTFSTTLAPMFGPVLDAAATRAPSN